MLRWHGGKWRLAPWIIRHMPPHRIYVEPFGGAASVLLRKPRSYAEVYNDLDAEAVNLFRVLRAPEQAGRLVRLLELTPFARDEFNDCYEPATDPVERARRLIVRAFMGYGADGAHSPYRTGFRANSNRRGSTPAHDWAGYPAAMAGLVGRLRGVVIESRDAVEVMRCHDSAETLHFVDPPYPHTTRSRSGRRPGGKPAGLYAHELTDQEHAALLEALRDLDGMVLLSGYACPLYDDALADWRRVEKDTYADGARPRTEVLWINEAAWAGLHECRKGPLL